MTLVVMAAGLGSRYGGCKQIDGVGPGGEILMEYSVYDAVRAGHGLLRDLAHDVEHVLAGLLRLQGFLTGVEAGDGGASHTGQLG